MTVTPPDPTTIPNWLRGALRGVVAIVAAFAVTQLARLGVHVQTDWTVGAITAALALGYHDFATWAEVKFPWAKRLLVFLSSANWLTLEQARATAKKNAEIAASVTNKAAPKTK